MLLVQPVGVGRPYETPCLVSATCTRGSEQTDLAFLPLMTGLEDGDAACRREFCEGLLCCPSAQYISEPHDERHTLSTFYVQTTRLQRLSELPTIRHTSRKHVLTRRQETIRHGGRAINTCFRSGDRSAGYACDALESCDLRRGVSTVGEWTSEATMAKDRRSREPNE
ncbi:unnamed protein product [Protopolystoma xenopodis]|uniref:Uncharacterized protein n=1 Tax=Protopolystoma xenopodis TaxID=117903 RepID=A0A448XK26_9PLAT|nr:unnamed protein product [Protopolystoma xenopodis]